MSRLTVILMLLLAAVPAAPLRADSAYSEEQRRLDLESFDQVWTTVRDTHWDPQLGGIDWQAVRDELRPRVVAAKSTEEARRLMQEALDRLGHSHFAILSSHLAAELGSQGDDEAADEGGDDWDAGDAGGGTGETGLELRLLGDTVVVSSVVAGSPASAAGVQPGWRLEAIGDDTLAPMIEQWQQEQPGRGSELLLISALRLQLQGPPGEPLQLTLADGNDERHVLTLELARGRGKRARLGHLPAMPVWIEWRVLPSGVGYIAFSHFFDPARLMTSFAEAMQSFIDKGVPGVIVDVRGNPGGVGAMAMGMAGWFIADKGKHLGTMQTRESSLRFVVFPRPQIYDGPLVILVDGLSASTSEIFAGGLQDLGRARIIGSPTAAMSLPSRVDRLANGDSFQYAFANFLSGSGVSLEDHGVQPDEPVEMTRQGLLAGRDEAREAAEQWMLTQATDPSTEAANGGTSP